MIKRDAWISLGREIHEISRVNWWQTGRAEDRGGDHEAFGRLSWRKDREGE